MFGSSLATHGQQAFCFLQRFHFSYSQRFLFSIWETSKSVNKSSASSVNKSSGFAFSSFMQISDRAGTEHAIQIIRIRDHKAHMNNSDHKTQRSFLRPLYAFSAFSFLVTKKISHEEYVPILDVVARKSAATLQL